MLAWSDAAQPGQDALVSQSCDGKQLQLDACETVSQKTRLPQSCLSSARCIVSAC